MNRKEVKSFLPILQAFADGKEIECHEEDKWYKVLEICNEMNPQDYRIKPEHKYRPFKDAEECWQELLKHQPFGWVKDKKDGHHALITAVDDDTCGMSLNGNAAWSLSGIMDLFTFADGVPFGIKVE
jgi:hypothetical protein